MSASPNTYRLYGHSRIASFRDCDANCQVNVICPCCRKASLGRGTCRNYKNRQGVSLISLISVICFVCMYACTYVMYVRHETLSEAISIVLSTTRGSESRCSESTSRMRERKNGIEAWNKKKKNERPRVRVYMCDACLFKRKQNQHGLSA